MIQKYGFIINEAVGIPFGPPMEGLTVVIDPKISTSAVIDDESKTIKFVVQKTLYFDLSMKQISKIRKTVTLTNTDITNASNNYFKAIIEKLRSEYVSTTLL